jgi:tripartite ATP-independent transporter DctM subunit
VGKLFIAGIIPGIIEATLFSIMVYVWCRVVPGIGAALPAASWKEKFVSLKGSGGMLIIAVVVMGGIYGGIFTPTEAGGIAAISALAIAMFSRQLTWEKFKQSLQDTGKTTAMIFLTLVGVLILLRFLALSGTVRLFISSLIELPLPDVGTLIVIIFIYLILGMFISVIGMLMLTLPVFFPIIMEMGYDPIWFGILVVTLSEIAFITPPVAMNIYAVKAVAPEIPTEEIIKGVLPFLAMTVVFIVILMAFPEIATWLPSTMRGG